MRKIISVVGTRPNFMKVAPIHRAFQEYAKSVRHLICHTGQHYDDGMSSVFFRDLDLPTPDFYLGIGSGSHATQTAAAMVEFEKVVISERPDLVLVVGDVNSTLACALVGAKAGIPVAHVEAGLRSHDRSMPEEINRIVTDAIADLLFVSEPSGVTNLTREGIAVEKVHFVGNVMIDSLVRALPILPSSGILERLGLAFKAFIVVTMHRPPNVDARVALEAAVELMERLASLCRVVFPIHPRTLARLEEYNLAERLARKVTYSSPLGYKDFIWLIQNSAAVVTDSGGIQEETTYLGIPCITLRNSTERPITIERGTNILVGSDFQRAFNEASAILGGQRTCDMPKIELWDGLAASRIARIITQKFA